MKKKNSLYYKFKNWNRMRGKSKEIEKWKNRKGA